MKTRKLMVAMLLAVVTLSFGAQVFAADKIQDRTKTTKKDGSCK